MKRKWQYYWNSKMFRRLQISFSVLLFCSLFLIMGIYFKRILEDVKEEELRIMQNRIDTVVKDLEQQTTNMKNYVLDIVSQEVFNPNNVREDKYREIELLNTMKRYSQVSQITEFYFIKYKQSDIIYTSLGTLMHVDRYFGEKLMMEDYEAEKELLQYLCETDRDKLVLHRMDETLLFLYPLQKYFPYSSNRYGVVGFQVTQKELQERMEFIAGEIRGKVVIYYNDLCIFGDEGNVEEDIEWVSAQQGKYRVYVYMNDEIYFSWKNVFSSQEIAMIGLLIIVLLIVMWGLIKWNYKPLKTITDKYDLVNENAPDWKHIEEAFDCFIKDKEKDNKQMRMQYRLLRELIIRRVVSGEDSEQLQNWMNMLGIKLNGLWYCVIQCEILEEHIEDKTGICENVEELSDEEYQLYAYWENDRKLCVLISSKEEYFFEEVSQLLQSIIDSRILTGKITVLKCWNNLNSKVSKEPTEIKTRKKNVGSDYSNKTIKTALEYIRDHCTEYNLTLEVIAAEVQVTPAHLCKIIKKEVGMNYKEYLTMLRMEEAERLLQLGDQSVIEISQQVGYVNISYFIKLFQKHTGMTPAIYKEHYRKKRE